MRGSAGVLATGLIEVTDDPGALDRGRLVGRGRCRTTAPPVLARFAEVREAARPDGRWRGPAAPNPGASRRRATQYVDAVEHVRERIAAGDVYQANVCRVLSAGCPDPDRDATSPGSPGCSPRATRRRTRGFVDLPQAATRACPPGAPPW